MDIWKCELRVRGGGGARLQKKRGHRRPDLENEKYEYLAGSHKYVFPVTVAWTTLLHL